MRLVGRPFLSPRLLNSNPNDNDNDKLRRYCCQQWNGRAKALSLEAQAAQLLEVSIQLGLSWFVGLGVGAGANVLLRFACDNPDRVAGLILANGSAEAAGEH